MRSKSRIRFLLNLIFLIGFLGITFLFWYNDSDHIQSEKYTFYNLQKRPLTLEGHCKIIHVGIVSTQSREITDYLQMIKSVLINTNSDLVLYISTDGEMGEIWNKILGTWRLKGITVKYYEENFNKREPLSDNLKLKRVLKMQQYYAVDTLLFIDPKIRFLIDPYHYVTESGLYKSSLMITSSNQVHTSSKLPKLIILKYEEEFFEEMLSRINTGSDDIDLESIQASNDDWLTDLGYTTNVHPKAYLLPYLHMTLADLYQYSHVPLFNKLLEGHNTSLYDVIRRVPECFGGLNEEETSTAVKIMRDNCYHYRKQIEYNHITHYRYIDSRQSMKTFIPEEFDVTLITMLTVDRFGHFIDLIINWGSGPVVAVLLVDFDEGEKLYRMINDSQILQRKKYITYHLVYKHADLAPLNYLRNVGLLQIYTPWKFFDDVDLIPVPDLYQKMKTLLSIEKDRYPLTYNKTAYIVPAFVVKKGNLGSKFPRSKQKLLPLLNSSAVSGWGQSWGWKYGHRVTDFRKWVKTDSSYGVNYQHLMEPWMVVPTHSRSTYDETLTERLRNKIAYPLALYVEGFKFRVLNDVFIIHKNHEIVKNWKRMSKNLTLHKKCAFKIYADYVRRLQRDNPSVAFPNDTLLELRLGKALDTVPQADLGDVSF